MSPRAGALIANGANTLSFSAASAWEIAIKAARGRLPLPEPADGYVAARLALHHITVLPVEVSHALEVAHLSALHADPFDRLLVARARLENLAAEAVIARYGVEVLW